MEDTVATHYADKIWEGEYSLITNGIVDKWFSSCNLTSSATTLSYHLATESKEPYLRFMEEFIAYAQEQPFLSSDQVQLSWFLLTYAHHQHAPADSPAARVTLTTETCTMVTAWSVQSASLWSCVLPYCICAGLRETTTTTCSSKH